VIFDAVMVLGIRYFNLAFLKWCTSFLYIHTY